MDLESLKTGDLVQLVYCSEQRLQALYKCFEKRGILLGLTNDVPFTNYVRVHLLDFSGKVHSTLCGMKSDSIVKIS